MSLFLAYKGLSPFYRSFVSAILGLIVYGGWAIAVNLMHGDSLAFKAGLVQGSYSFLLTFVSTMLIEISYRRIARFMDSAFLAIVVTVMLCCGLIFSSSWLVNYLFATPEIFKTVVLGYVFGGIYCVVYTVALARENNAVSGF